MHTFNLEHYMRFSASHLESLVDERGRTYFDIFRTTPAEAVFDWPDYVDLPARYLEASILLQPVLGRPVTTAPALRQWLFSHFEADGLCYRPETLVASHWAELFDQARLMYLLITGMMAHPEDGEFRTRLEKMCQTLKAKATFEKDYAYIEKIGIYFGGTLIRPLVQAGLALKDPQWIEFAGAMSRGIIDHSDYYGPDGSFSGHHHGHLGTLAGILAYAVLAGDTRMRDRVRAIFDWSRSISTAAGFIPEVANRSDDLIVCETCTLMDYLDMALLLARHVDGRYWDVVEKAVRNQLVEAQINNPDWLAEEPRRPDEEDIIRTDIRRRVTGAFAGWAAPHAQLGVAEEQQRDTWVKTPALQPRYWGKIRALQNCCAGAGVRALHQVWSNLATFADGTLSVNLLMDKAIPEAVITSFIPFEGRVNIQLRRDCAVRFRVAPEVAAREVRATVAGRPVALTPDGVFLNAGKLAKGDTLEIALPLPARTETFTVGNPGFQSYKFEADWKGDTVVAMRPDPANPTTGYSFVMKTKIPVYFGADAPGLMYQREDWRADRRDVTPAALTEDTRAVDWFSLK